MSAFNRVKKAHAEALQKWIRLQPAAEIELVKSR